MKTDYRKLTPEETGILRAIVGGVAGDKPPANPLGKLASEIQSGERSRSLCRRATGGRMERRRVAVDPHTSCKQDSYSLAGRFAYEK